VRSQRAGGPAEPEPIGKPTPTPTPLPPRPPNPPMPIDGPLRIVGPASETQVWTSAPSASFPLRAGAPHARTMSS
jgi:hypothetical protein